MHVVPKGAPRSALLMGRGCTVVDVVVAELSKLQDQRPPTFITGVVT